ncbi:MAG: HU family DNA-binding protein [Anaerolineae bacterium]|nr:MAG: HU family DNA-binding protein [Anaerolineae bacterium]
MNHRQTVTEISKRLPRLKRRDVAEVLEVMTELWLDELAQPGETVTVADLGKLAVEVQTVRSGGAVGQRTVKRVYVRFRPTGKFRQFVLNAYIKEGALE